MTMNSFNFTNWRFSVCRFPIDCYWPSFRARRNTWPLFPCHNSDSLYVGHLQRNLNRSLVTTFIVCNNLRPSRAIAVYLLFNANSECMLSWVVFYGISTFIFWNHSVFSIILILCSMHNALTFLQFSYSSVDLWNLQPPVSIHLWSWRQYVHLKRLYPPTEYRNPEHRNMNSTYRSSYFFPCLPISPPVELLSAVSTGLFCRVLYSSSIV
jgi:hypothetical protein